jgi:hypothetical protein
MQFARTVRAWLDLRISGGKPEKHEGRAGKAQSRSNAAPAFWHAPKERAE